MSIYSKVIWSEGMFMLPQHFQQHDRYLEYLINQRPTGLGAYAWGISELKIDQPMLSLGKIAISACQGILPDGTVFNIPSNDEAPPPLEVSGGLNDTIVYLALPLRRSGMPEVGYKDDNNIYRYRTDNLEVSDNNTGFNSDSQIQVGKLCLRLMLEQEDRSGYACFGVARIKESHADHNVILDDQFIPTCIDVHAIPAFNKFLHEMVSLLNYRGENLAARVTSAVQEGTSEMSDFMLLQLVNRFEPLFIHLSSLKGLHPTVLYEILIRLMGELSTYTRDERRPINLPAYQHDNLQQTFKPLIEELRRSLSMVLEQNAISLSLEQRQYGIWVAPIADKSLVDEATFVLAVHADMQTKDIQARFPSQVKIASVEHIRTLVTKALPGIDLQLLASTPRQIPYHTNFVYFALNRRHQFWPALANSGGIAFHVGGNFPGLKLELWAIRG